MKPRLISILLAGAFLAWLFGGSQAAAQEKDLVAAVKKATADLMAADKAVTAARNGLVGAKNNLDTSIFNSPAYNARITAQQLKASQEKLDKAGPKDKEDALEIYQLALELAEKRKAELEAAEKLMPQREAAAQAAEEKYAVVIPAGEKLADQIKDLIRQTENDSLDKLTAVKLATEKASFAKAKADQKAEANALIVKTMAELVAADKTLRDTAAAWHKTPELAAAAAQKAKENAAETRKTADAQAAVVKSATKEQAAAEQVAQKTAAAAQAAEKQAKEAQAADSAAKAALKKASEKEKAAAEKLAKEKAIAAQTAQEKVKEAQTAATNAKSALDKIIAKVQAADKAAKNTALAAKDAEQKAAAAQATFVKVTAERPKMLAESEKTTKAYAAILQTAGQHLPAVQQLRLFQLSAAVVEADKAVQKTSTALQQVKQELQSKINAVQARLNEIKAAQVRLEKTIAKLSARKDLKFAQESAARAEAAKAAAEKFLPPKIEEADRAKKAYDAALQTAVKVLVQAPDAEKALAADRAVIAQAMGAKEVDIKKENEAQAREAAESQKMMDKANATRAAADKLVADRRAVREGLERVLRERFYREVNKTKQELTKFEAAVSGVEKVLQTKIAAWKTATAAAQQTKAAADKARAEAADAQAALEKITAKEKVAAEKLARDTAAAAKAAEQKAKEAQAAATAAKAAWEKTLAQEKAAGKLAQDSAAAAKVAQLKATQAQAAATAAKAALEKAPAKEKAAAEKLAKDTAAAAKAAAKEATEAQAAATAAKEAWGKNLAQEKTADKLAKDTAAAAKAAELKGKEAQAATVAPKAALEKILAKEKAADKLGKAAAAAAKSTEQKAAAAQAVQDKAAAEKAAAEQVVAQQSGTLHAALSKLATAKAAAYGGLKPLPESAWDYAKARHLLVRAGFGGTPDEVARLHALGLQRAVDYLVNFKKLPPADIAFMAYPRERPEPYEVKLSGTQQEQLRQRRQQKEAQQIQNMRTWWMRRMIESPRPLEEKLTLFWHGHFAVQYSDVADSYFMYLQNQLFRDHAAGNFASLLHGITHDAAMLKYLNNDTNVKGRANENLAREIMELFGMGRDQGYTEIDIRQGARALTGYTYDFWTGQFRFIEARHDSEPKTIFGKTGNWCGDDFANLILETPYPSKFIARQMFKFFAHDDPAIDTVEALAKVLSLNNYELVPMLENLFLSEEFYSAKAMGTQIKGPIQLVVGLHRDLGLKDPNLSYLISATNNMGQLVFEPPSVFGWPAGRAWINSTRVFSRYNALADILEAMPRGGKNGVDVVGTLLAGKKLQTHAEVVDFLSRSCLNVPLPETKRQALIDFLSPLPPPSQWEAQAGAVNARLTRMLAILMSSPEYQLT